MTAASRYRGLASLDALLSLLPFLIMLLLLSDAVHSLARDAEQSSNRQQVFDRTASVADYTVKAGAARHEGSVRYPNWIDPGLLTEEYSDAMKARSGLSDVYIGLEEPIEGYQVCLYRIVVIGDLKDIRKLHVCGG